MDQIKNFIKNLFLFLFLFLFLDFSYAGQISDVSQEAVTNTSNTSNTSVLNNKNKSKAEASTVPFQIYRFNTAEGMPVIFIPVHDIPILVAKLGFYAGSGYDPIGAFGLADFVAHGIGAAMGDQIAEQLDSSGAMIQANVSPDLSVLTMHALTDPEDLNNALSTFVPMVTALNFSESNFQFLKQEQLAEIGLKNKNPVYLAETALKSDLFNGTPYAHPVIGDVASVGGLTQSMCLNFYQNYYVVQNAFLVLVGDINLDQAHVWANAFSSHLPNGARASGLLIQPGSIQRRLIHIDFNSDQTTVLMGARAYAAKDPKNPALLAGMTMIAGPTMDSILFHRLRQLSLVDGLRGIVQPDEFSGWTGLLAQTQSQNVDVVIQTMQSTLDAVSSGTLDTGAGHSVFENARNFLIGNFSLSYGSDEKLADLMKSLLAYQFQSDYIQNRPQDFLLLTQKAVQTTFESLENNNNNNSWVTVTVGKN